MMAHNVMCEMHVLGLAIDSRAWEQGRAREPMNIADNGVDH